MPPAGSPRAAAFVVRLLCTLAAYLAVAYYYTAYEEDLGARAGSAGRGSGQGVPCTGKETSQQF